MNKPYENVSNLSREMGNEPYTMDHGEELINEIAHITPDNVSKIVEIINRENKINNMLYCGVLQELATNGHKIAGHLCDLSFLEVVEIYTYCKDGDEIEIEFALQITENDEIDLKFHFHDNLETKKFCFCFEEL